MSLAFFTGFESGYLEANSDVLLEQNWTVVSGNWGIDPPARTARHGAHNAGNWLWTGAIGKTFPVGVNEWIVGVALNSADNWMTSWIEFYEGATKQCYVGFDNTTKKFGFYRGDGAKLWEEGSAYNADKWYYYEIHVKIADGTSGLFGFHRDGVSVTTGYEAGGLDSRNGGASGSVDTIYFQTTYGGSAIDDLYMIKVDGNGLNTFLGDIRIDALRATGDHAKVWSPSTGTDNFALVDDHPANTTDYVSSSNVGDVDLYAFDTVPYSSGTVYAVAPVMVVKKDDSGAKQASSVLHVGGTDYAGSGIALDNDLGYHQYMQIWEKNPDTNSNWNIAQINALIAGPKVVA